MKKILDVSINKIYIMLVILISLFMLGGYFSYAMFTVTKEKSNVISIVTGNLIYDLKVDDKEGNTLTIPANTTIEFTVTLSNPNNRIARFNFYYLGSLPDGVTAGYVVSEGFNIPMSEVGSNLEKSGTSGSSNTYKIKVTNTNDSEITINLGVEVGLDYNDLTLPSNGHLFEEYKVNVSDIVLTSPGENGDTYDDGTDTFITGTNPDNYIWYSGKLWRAVLVNNEGKTTKLVTQWNISIINYDISGQTNFKDSYMEDWLNDTTVDGFLGNLRDPEKFIKMDGIWNNTAMKDTSKPAKTTMVESPVGLLNIYEYTMSYNGTNSSSGYLNNNLYWWTLSPYDSSSMWTVRYASNADTDTPSYYSSGIRPSIILQKDVKVVDGDGTKEKPYRLEGDNDKDLNGVKLNTRYSGEYISFGAGENNLYRIVSHENDIGTKITSAKPLKENSNFKNISFGSTITFSSTNTIGRFLNGEYLTNYLTVDNRNMIEDNTTWYLETVGYTSYKLAKYKDETGKELTSRVSLSKVGLLRYGELMSGQFNKYEENADFWLLNPYASSYVWYINIYSGGPASLPSSSTIGIKPALNLKSNVVITGGDGTKQNPFEIELK